MEIEIRDEVNYLCLLMDNNQLLLNKSHIRSVAVVGGDSVKIDMSQEPLNQLYIRYADVVLPSGIATPEDLRDAIFAMVKGNTSTTDAALLTALDDVSRKLADINTSINNSCDTETRALIEIAGTLDDIKTILDGAYNRYKEPLRIDEVSPNLIYKGFIAVVSGGPAEPVWAIQRIKISGTLTTISWANGNRDFTNAWDDRMLLTYIPG